MPPGVIVHQGSSLHRLRASGFVRDVAAVQYRSPVTSRHRLIERLRVSRTHEPR